VRGSRGTVNRHQPKVKLDERKVKKKKKEQTCLESAQYLLAIDIYPREIKIVFTQKCVHDC
jgi:hypothetical protein